MKLDEAQAMLREHGLEDFPRPWIFNHAADVRIGEFRAYDNWRHDVNDAHYRDAREVARETALMMGWKPKGEGDG